MIVSIEISLYPLDKNYSPLIRDFIDRISKYPAIKVEVLAMSTLLIGDYDDCMSVIAMELKKSFETGTTVSTLLKIVNIDLADQ